MSRPGWVLIVGLIMSFISGCGGLFADLKQIKTEALMQLGDDIAAEISKELDTIAITEEDKEIFKGFATDSLAIDSVFTGEHMSQLIKENTRLSDSAMSAIILHGYMGLPLSILFLLFGILMIFSNKPYVIKGTMILLFVSLIFAVYQLIDIRNEDMADLMKKGQTFNLTSGGIVDIILLLICWNSNKQYFQPYMPEEDYYD